MSATPNKVTYIGGQDALLEACRQTFAWKTEETTLVILWHDGWLSGGHSSYWQGFHDYLSGLGDDTAVRIVVALFEEKPDDGTGSDCACALRALLLALATDTASGAGAPSDGLGGWCRITDFGRLSKAGVMWKRRKNSSLLSLLSVAATLTTPGRADPRPTLGEFFRFLADPVAFRTQALHGAEPENAVADLRKLKWLDTLATFGQPPKLKVLVVENNPTELKTRSNEIEKALKSAAPNVPTSPLGFLENAEFYLVDKKFQELAIELGKAEITAKKWDVEKGKIGEPVTINSSEIDLVLQDIVLEREGVAQNLSGLDLVPLFYQACPQALVFVITNLNVETLVGSGDVNWKYVDCIVSKSALATLWYEYRRCFRERFGRMFWADWGTAGDDERRLLRNLFGSLRRWQIEPDILWHGQTLPEMIDHANRHVSALWKLVNDVVGTLMERGGANPGVLSLRHRVALTISIWMHDVGHRGDEFFANSMDIRAAHAGISERLLLRNPEAYCLGWLLEDLPHMDCIKNDTTGRDARFECRNRCECAHESRSLCLLREAGLLCRHHQSNAPLDLTSLRAMAKRGKEPSVYSLVPDESAHLRKIKSEDFLREITNDALPSPSPQGVNVRTLEDFTTSDKKNFRAVAGVMRMLDALQIHRARVGSMASIGSFKEFLDVRFGWCASERIRLEEDRRAATPGKKSFQRVSAKLDELGEYEILLNVQGVHYWRQAAVHEIEVLWRWKSGGSASLVLNYRLDNNALDMINGMTAKVPRITGGKESEFGLGDVLDGNDPKEKWEKDFKKEVFGNEHKSQYGAEWTEPATEREKGYLNAMFRQVEFVIEVSDLQQPHVRPKQLIHCAHV